MLNNSNVTDTDQEILMANNLSSFVISVTLSLFALSSSLFSLCFLHTYLKKLHTIIKNILTILCGYNLMCCTVTCIILIYFRMTSQQTITLCGLIQLTTITPSMITFDTICIISVVRYHMTWKINQLELFNKRKILLSVGAVYFAEHILGMLFFIIASMDFSLTQPSTVCAGKDTLGKVPGMEYLLLTKSIIVFSIGVTYDFRLINLLKKRKLQRIGPGGIQMIPWKTSNSDEPDVKVPIRATIVTLSFILMRIAMVSYYKIFHKSPIHWIQPAVISCEVVIGVLMPVLLFLTIRAHKKKKNPVVPKGLMFHNDLYLNEECLESGENIEHPNYIYAIDPKIFTLDNFSDDHIDNNQKDDIDEETKIEIHHAVIHVISEPPSIHEQHLEAKDNIEQDNDILAIDPNIFALDHFSNIDNDQKEESVIKIHHDVIHVKPAPPYRTFSTCH